MLYVEPTQPDLTDPIHIAVPDEKAFLIKTLLNYDAPHYFARFNITGVSPGLEILEKYEHLLINRRLLNLIELESKKRLEAYIQYDVKNSRGMQLYLAVEEIKNPGSLRWTRDARLCEVDFYDFHCRRVFTMKRKCSCSYCFAQYLCLFCTYGFKGCGNGAEVVLPDGTLIGTIKQKLSFSSTVFHIYDHHGKRIMRIDGIVADGILDVSYPEDDEPIAMIETLMDDTEAFDYYKVSVPRFSCSSGITFFKNFITPEEKALLLSTVILLDYMILEPTSDYTHMVQQIPDDFQSIQLPRSSLHRSGSTELLVLTERSKKHYRNKSRLRGRCGCCIWCARLSCLCCFLGMKRNAVRCILLMFGIILLIIVTVLLVIYPDYSHVYKFGKKP